MGLSVPVWSRLVLLLTIIIVAVFPILSLLERQNPQIPVRIRLIYQVPRGRRRQSGLHLVSSLKVPRRLADTLLEDSSLFTCPFLQLWHPQHQVPALRAHRPAPDGNLPSSLCGEAGLRANSRFLFPPPVLAESGENRQGAGIP